MQPYHRMQSRLVNLVPDQSIVTLTYDEREFPMLSIPLADGRTLTSRIAPGLPYTALAAEFFLDGKPIKYTDAAAFFSPAVLRAQKEAADAKERAECERIFNAQREREMNARLAKLGVTPKTN